MDAERLHGSCADLLMDDYGVKKKFRRAVIKEIEMIWDDQKLPHGWIVAGVRGYIQITLTHSLESFLEGHKTHEPKYKNNNRTYTR